MKEIKDLYKYTKIKNSELYYKYVKLTGIALKEKIISNYYDNYLENMYEDLGFEMAKFHRDFYDYYKENDFVEITKSKYQWEFLKTVLYSIVISYLVIFKNIFRFEPNEFMQIKIIFGVLLFLNGVIIFSMNRFNYSNDLDKLLYKITQSKDVNTLILNDNKLSEDEKKSYANYLSELTNFEINLYDKVHDLSDKIKSVSLSDKKRQTKFELKDKESFILSILEKDRIYSAKEGVNCTLKGDMVLYPVQGYGDNLEVPLCINLIDDGESSIVIHKDKKYVQSKVLNITQEELRTLVKKGKIIKTFVQYDEINEKLGIVEEIGEL